MDLPCICIHIIKKIKDDPIRLAEHPEANAIRFPPLVVNRFDSVAMPFPDHNSRFFGIAAACVAFNLAGHLIARELSPRLKRPVCPVRVT